MKILNYLQDMDFLKALDNDTNKFFWVKIEVLDSNEVPLTSIEGKVYSGSTININGNSSVRRTCNINIIADEKENDLTNINHILSANKRIRILEGIKNNINNVYNDIIWFPLGIFVIIKPNITHTPTGCMIQLSCKDKMCLLNGECGGGLPTSIVFDNYNQIIGLKQYNEDPTEVEIYPNNYTIYKYIYNKIGNTEYNKYYTWSEEYGWIDGTEDAKIEPPQKDGSQKITVNSKTVGDTFKSPQLIYDIIQTLVCNYGGIDINKIFINDIPLEIKQIVRYTGSEPLYYNSQTNFFTTDSSYYSEATDSKVWRTFGYNEEIGYTYTSFTYPGSLVSNIGDNVCSILDRIKNTLGNYEYFFDVDGNFIFQEIRNYLNHSYKSTEKFRLSDYESGSIKTKINDLTILDNDNYEIDFYSNNRSVYTFNEGSGLILSYANSPNYNNLKNDFHIWGETKDKYAIHYHLVIKQKPIKFNQYQIVYLKEDNIDDVNNKYNGKIRLANSSDSEKSIVNFTPEDWRAELYLQGLKAKAEQQRPDIYQQELLDLFDSIYEWGYYENEQWKTKGRFKADLVYHPNVLRYFIDYIEPDGKLHDCSVDALGTRIYSYKGDKINKIYNVDIPNLILIDIGMNGQSKEAIVKKCERNGQPYANVIHSIYSNIALGSSGYTAQESVRQFLYQYTNYNESISLQSIPIYYLDVNTRITVQDKQSDIYGDYIIQNISLPLDASNSMNITAIKAAERI